MSNVSPVPMSKRWLAFSAVFIACLAVYISMFKASPLFAEFLNPENAGYAAFGFSPENIGLLMSASGIAGIILALPAGWLFNKIGAKVCLIIMAAFTVVGAFMGAFASNFDVLLASRVIEGVGVACSTVIAPSAVAAIIPMRKQGLAMALYGATLPLETVIAMLTVPSLYMAFDSSWSAIWIISAVLAIVALIYVVLFYRELPPDSEDVAAMEAMAKTDGPAGAPAGRTNLLAIAVLALGMFIWGFFWPSSFNAFYPTYLFEACGFTLAFASMAVAITSAVNIVFAPIAGMACDKLNTRKWVLFFGYAGAAVLTAFAWNGSTGGSWVAIICLGVFAACVPTAIMAAAPEHAGAPQKIAIVMAVIAICSNAGTVVGGIVYPMVRLSFEGAWEPAALALLVPLLAVGALTALLIKEKHPAVADEQEPEAAA